MYDYNAIAHFRMEWEIEMNLPFHNRILLSPLSVQLAAHVDLTKPLEYLAAYEKESGFNLQNKVRGLSFRTYKGSDGQIAYGVKGRQRPGIYKEYGDKFQ